MGHVPRNAVVRALTLMMLFMLMLFPLAGLAGCSNTAQTRLLISVTTTTGIMAADAADRPRIAKEVYAVGDAIHRAAGTQTDLSGVRDLAKTYLVQSNSPDAPIVFALVNTITGLVQTEIDNAKLANDDAKLAALRSFLLAASAGMMDGALPYAQDLPVPPVGAVAVAKRPLDRRIVVQKLEWVKRPPR